MVRSLPSETFDQQLAELASLGTIKPLRAVAEGDIAASGPTFALSFDDDWHGYNEHVVPILAAHGVTATFFLSGRMLANLGPTWWEALEVEIREDGLRATAGRLGLVGSTPAELAKQIQGTPLSREIEARHAALGPVMNTAEVQKLSASGQDVRFHTRAHRDLPTLAADELNDEMQIGRQELAALANQPMDLLAYPHGTTSDDVQAAARDAGFIRSFTTNGRAHKASDLPFEMGRWDPVAVAGPEFRTHVAARLVRAQLQS